MRFGKSKALRPVLRIFRILHFFVINEYKTMSVKIRTVLTFSSENFFLKNSPRRDELLFFN